MEKTGKKIFDRLRNLQITSQKSEIFDVKEKFSSKHFAYAEVSRHGFPYQPTCLSYDPVQKLLAIGTQNGSVRIFGRPGVDLIIKHESRASILKIQFLINEGAFITLCSDNCIHLWNFKQKQPEIVHSLKFQRERLTTLHLPFQSKWLYMGTDRGNVHIVAVESFTLSGYVINWNKAIDLSQKTHPGFVLHLSDCPTDESKLLIGFERGNIVLWDLKNRLVEARFLFEQGLKCIAWHFEGKQFVCGHSNGSLTTWSIKRPSEPLQYVFPHARPAPSNVDESVSSTAVASPAPSRRHRFRPIACLDWKHQRNGDDLLLFAGGTPLPSITSDASVGGSVSASLNNSAGIGAQHSVTVLRGKSVAVLEMSHRVVDVVALVDSPYAYDESRDASALVVLTHGDLAVVDLNTAGYPCFENPNAMDVHESPVTACLYLADCLPDLIPALYSAGSKQKKRNNVGKHWPIKGGECAECPFSYSELIITGHADGSVKFWDSSSTNLQVLYKVKTSKFFERTVQRQNAPDEGVSVVVSSDADICAIEHIDFCQDSRLLAIAGQSGHVILFKFDRQEINSEISVVEVTIPLEAFADEAKNSDSTALAADVSDPHTNVRRGELKQQTSVTSLGSDSNSEKEHRTTLALRAKGGPIRQAAGFQAELICLTLWYSSHGSESVAAMALNSAYNLLAYATERGLAVVDICQQICILAMATCDLYGGSSGAPEPATPMALTTMSRQAGRSSTPFEKNAPVDVAELGSNSPSAEIKSSTASGSSSLEVSQSHSLVRQTAVVACTASAPSGSLTPTSTSSVGGQSPHGAKPSGLPASTAGAVGVSAGHPPRLSFNKTQGGGNGSPSRLRRPFFKSQTVASDDYTPPGPTLSRVLTTIENPTMSRSSSCSSLDNAVIVDSVRCLLFMDTCLSKKNESFSGPTLWVGTSQGSVLALNLRINFETRLEQLASALPTGFRINSECGSLLKLAFIDQNNDLLLPPADSWRDSTKSRDKLCRNRVFSKSRACPASPSTSCGPTSQTDGGVGPAAPVGSFDSSGALTLGTQFLVVVGERGIKIFSVQTPGKVLASAVDQSSAMPLIAAAIVTVQDASTGAYAPPIVTTVCRQGRLLLYGLPSLKVLAECQAFDSRESLRISRTIQFSQKGNGIFMCSPSEIQKFTILSEVSALLQSGACVPNLFQPVNMPEPPRQNFFKELFVGSNSKSLDREELFGESSGKTFKSIATHIPGSSNVEQLRSQSGGATSEIVRARLALNERGEKLGEVEERTAQLFEHTKSYSDNAQNLLNKYKKKKWYQL